MVEGRHPSTHPALHTFWTAPEWHVEFALSSVILSCFNFVLLFSNKHLLESLELSYRWEPILHEKPAIHIYKTLNERTTCVYYYNSTQSSSSLLLPHFALNLLLCLHVVHWLLRWWLLRWWLQSWRLLRCLPQRLWVWVSYISRERKIGADYMRRLKA